MWRTTHIHKSNWEISILDLQTENYFRSFYYKNLIEFGKCRIPTPKIILDQFCTKTFSKLKSDKNNIPAPKNCNIPSQYLMTVYRFFKNRNFSATKNSFGKKSIQNGYEGEIVLYTGYIVVGNCREVEESWEI